METNFRKQIEQDIKGYQDNFKFIANIHKDEWAFNYWVLDKLFYEDDELIEEKIIDYNDLGTDAFEIYEDAKEIYLIQNKYYSENTGISAGYVKNDFLIRTITALENGTYSKSKELQNAFNKWRNDPEFVVYLQLFVTNNVHCKEADEYIKEFNKKHPKYIAKIFYLDDIKARYYDEIQQNKKNITVKIESINKGTILNINSENYKLENVLDARYVLTPVVSIYRLYRDSIEKGYPLFEKNIREYLGNKGVNSGIYQTLQSNEDRINFFYYNNGITMICDKMSSISTQPSSHNMNAYFTVDNPQIVNGCQTVNTIYEFLNNVSPEVIEKEFKDTFVMLKILVINRLDESKNILYRNIVKYNNSQNAIDEKTFIANTGIFQRLQNEFEDMGFLLLIKQSDKNKFSSKYKVTTKLDALAHEHFERFGISSHKNISDFYIPLEKLLQVINAYVAGGHMAYTKKSQVLKFNSEAYNNAVNFIKKNEVTNKVLLDLYLLYKRAEQEKKEENDQRAPIPYYLIDFFAKYECKNRSPQKIEEWLTDENAINTVVEKYKKVTRGYAKKYYKTYDIEYNQMIKRPVEYEFVEEIVDYFV